MTQLGILQGVGDNRFHPQGSYTVEQCFSSLVRLLQKITPYPGPSPFAMTQEEAVIGGFCGSREMVAYADTENTAQVTGQQLGPLERVPCRVQNITSLSLTKT